MIFCSGFGWSGSSAVADWLQHNEATKKTAGGEVNQVRVSAHFLQELALNKRQYGFEFAVRTLFPDADIRQEKLLSIKPAERLSASQKLIDRLYIKVKKKPSDQKIRAKLQANLGADFSECSDYMSAATNLLEGFSEHIKSSSTESLLYKESLDLLEVFTLKNAITIFDNGINGRNLNFLSYVLNECGSKAFATLVVRDPRDQFADMYLIKRKRPIDLPLFIRSCKEDYWILSRLMKEVSNKNLRIISFENFVNNESGLRESLQHDIESIISGHGLNSNWSPNGPFDPEESKQNIGIHKNIPKYLTNTIEKYLLPGYSGLLKKSGL